MRVKLWNVGKTAREKLGDKFEFASFKKGLPDWKAFTYEELKAELNRWEQ